MNAREGKRRKTSLLGFFAHTDPAAAKKPRRRYRFPGGSIALPERWYARGDSLLVRRMRGSNWGQRRVAAFDFDGCLTTDAGGFSSSFSSNFSSNFLLF